MLVEGIGAGTGVDASPAAVLSTVGVPPFAPGSGVPVGAAFSLPNFRKKATFNSGSDASCFHTKFLKDSSIFCALIEGVIDEFVPTLESAALE